MSVIPLEMFVLTYAFQKGLWGISAMGVLASF